MASRAEWKSKTGFLLAALGSAIGLGNIWRFPYIAYRNGGGAFLIPYFVALFVVGVPLLMLEFGLGHHFRRAFPQSLRQIHPRFAWIGWWAVSFVMFGIVAYYGVVIAWCGNYLIYSFTQPWGELSAVNSFFDESFLAAFEQGVPFAVYTADGGFQLGSFNPWIVASLAVIWLVNWLITRRQLQHGVELASRVFIPALIVFTLVLVAWSWNFEGAAAGRELYTTPEWSRVFESQTWIDAFSQIFFTLSLAFGIMVAYASYLPRETDIPTSAFLAAFGNCMFSLVAGFAVFSAIGLLAHEQGINLEEMRSLAEKIEKLESEAGSSSTENVNETIARLQGQFAAYEQFETQMSSFGLVFKTYPAIITRMGTVAGPLFGGLFFLSLLVAGISSSISIVEAFMSALVDQFDWQRGRVAMVLCVCGFLCGLVFCSQAGLFWLDLVDHFITTYGLVLVAICETLIVGWLFPVHRLRSHLDKHHVFRLKRTFSAAMRLLITTILMLTWLGLARYQPDTVASAIGRFLLVGSGIVLWIDEHWLDFNIRLVVPTLLVFLLDQALLEEVTTPYGGYPLAAVLVIGLGWLLGTLAIGVGLSLVSVRSSTPVDSNSVVGDAQTVGARR
jgi:NSS family neurotransmitter:Na+ symporter